MAYDNLAQLVTEPWRERAGCKDKPVRWFFPDVEQVGRLGIRKARATCAECPVKVPCLARALTTNTPGIWAGTTQAQRRPWIGRDLVKAIPQLLAVAFFSTTRGKWRSALAEDWKEPAA